MVQEAGEENEDMGEKDEEEEEELANQKNKQKQKQKVLKRGTKKRAKREGRTDIKNHKDYELFLRDLEDDPELRQNVNLYRDDDIVAQLEAKISNMNLDDDASQLKKDLETGKTKVGGEERSIKTATRKTDEGKTKASNANKERLKGDMIIKANMRTDQEE